MNASYKNATIAGRTYFQLCVVFHTADASVFHVKNASAKKNAPAVVHNVCRERINFEGDSRRKINSSETTAPSCREKRPQM